MKSCEEQAFCSNKYLTISYDRPKMYNFKEVTTAVFIKIWQHNEYDVTLGAI